MVSDLRALSVDHSSAVAILWYMNSFRAKAFREARWAHARLAAAASTFHRCYGGVSAESTEITPTVSFLPNRCSLFLDVSTLSWPRQGGGQESPFQSGITRAGGAQRGKRAEVVERVGSSLPLPSRASLNDQFCSQSGHDYRRRPCRFYRPKLPQTPSGGDFKNHHKNAPS